MRREYPYNSAIRFAERIKWVGVALVALCFALAILTSTARGQSAPHPDHAADHFYASWMMPDKPAVSCCSLKDCGPAQAKIVDGKWFARWTVDEDWVAIPPEKVERDRDMPDGRAHLCGYRSHDGSFYVYCFGAGAGG